MQITHYQNGFHGDSLASRLHRVRLVLEGRHLREGRVQYHFHKRGSSFLQLRRPRPTLEQWIASAGMDIKNPLDYYHRDRKILYL
jgi:hypothetical protein